MLPILKRDIFKAIFYNIHPYRWQLRTDNNTLSGNINIAKKYILTQVTSKRQMTTRCSIFQRRHQKRLTNVLLQFFTQTHRQTIQSQVAYSRQDELYRDDVRRELGSRSTISPPININIPRVAPRRSRSLSSCRLLRRQLYCQFGPATYVRAFSQTFSTTESQWQSSLGDKLLRYRSVIILSPAFEIQPPFPRCYVTLFRFFTFLTPTRRTKSFSD